MLSPDLCLEFEIATGSVQVKGWGHRIDVARCRPIEKRVNLRPSTAPSIKIKTNSGLIYNYCN